MFSSTSLHTTSTQSALLVAFDPSYVLNQQDLVSERVTYDTETGLLIYKQDRELASQPVQFVVPAAIEGYTVAVKSETGGDILPQTGQILLAALTLYQETSIEFTFTPTSATASKPRKPKFKIDIRVRPTGGG